MTDGALDPLFPQGTGAPLAEGFVQWGPRLLERLQQSFPGGAVYFETGCCGRSGGQCAVAAREGRVVCSPSCSRGGTINTALPGVQVHALWPSPVNPDTCFTAAGFTDLEDADPAWEDNQAAALVQRVLDALVTHFGPAQLRQAPIMRRQPWYRALFSRPQALPLREQRSRPMHDDRHPLAATSFGGSRARVRGGDGHQLLWIDGPSPAPAPFDA